MRDADPVALHPAEDTITLLPKDFSCWSELLAFILRAFACMDGVIDPPSSAYALTPEKLARKARAETVFLAWADGELAGCLFADVRADHLYLGKLAVEPSLQGRGIGRRLIGAAQAFAQEQGLATLELRTRVELTGNQQAFAKLGFVETGRTAHPGFSRATSITMRKPSAWA